MTNDRKSDITKYKELSKAQIEFLEFCLQLNYGKVEVIVRDGEPVYATQVKQDTKFG